MAKQQFKGSRFDLVWLGEILPSGTELGPSTVATSFTLQGIRRFARLRRVDDSNYRIDEFTNEFFCFGEDSVQTHKIKP